MLEEHRVAAHRGVEEPELVCMIDPHQRHRETEHRCGKEHDDAGGVDGPNEERQARPVRSSARIVCVVAMKLIAVMIDESPRMKIPVTTKTTAEGVLVL